MTKTISFDWESPLDHFGFCPVCGSKYRLPKVVDYSWKCFTCNEFITIKKTYYFKRVETPSSRWFG